MKKVLAMVVAVVTMAATGVAQKPKSAITAGKPAVAPSINAGYVPLFTDGAGDLADSVMFENTGTGNVGVGTANPTANLHILGSNPTMRIEQYGPVGLGYSPNFNFYSGNGTAASPTATQDGDNLGQFAASGWNGTGFPASSKVKVTFSAVGPWTTTSMGTAMSFQTTSSADTTAHRTTRMYIDNNGNVGIGSIYGGTASGNTPPPYPLTVNGIIDSATGGYRFPDSTVQTTAAVSGVALTSPDSSILVTGSGTAALTVEANPAVVQARVINCAGGAITQIAANGTATCGTVGPGGTLANTPVIVATSSFAGGYGSGTVQNIYTAPASGYYRVSVYMNVPTTGTCGTPPCAGEAIVVQWNDGISTTALATSASCNLVTVCGASGSVPLLFLQSGQSITAQGQSNGGGSAPTGTPSYNAYVLVEQM